MNQKFQYKKHELQMGHIERKLLGARQEEADRGSDGRTLTLDTADTF